MAGGNVYELASCGQRSDAVSAILNLLIQSVAIQGVGRNKRLAIVQSHISVA